MEENKCTHINYYVQLLYFTFLDENITIKVVDFLNKSFSNIIREKIETTINEYSSTSIEFYRDKWPYDIKVNLKCFCQDCNEFLEKTEIYYCSGDIYFTCKHLYRDLINELLLKYTKVVDLNKTYVFFNEFNFLQDIFEYRKILEPLVNNEEKIKLENYENAFISAPREFGGEPLETIVNTIYSQIAIGLLTTFIWEISKYGILKIKNKLKQRKIEKDSLKELKRLLLECEQIQNNKQRKEAKNKLKKLIKAKSNDIYKQIMSL